MGTASYLLLSSPIRGHVSPVQAVGAALVAKGHRVRMLTGARFRPAIERDGMAFLAWPPAADYDDRNLDRAFPGRARLRGGPAVQFDLSSMWVKPLCHQFQAITAALAVEPVDGIVAELSSAGLLPLLLSGRARPPIHILGCTPLPLPSRDTFPFGLGLAPPLSALGRVRARLLTQVAQRWVLAKVQREANALLGSLGLGSSPVLFLEWFILAERFWQLSVPGFEYPRSDLAPNIDFAGPILPPGRTGLPDWWDDLDGARWVVHVTQGTIDNRDLSQLIGPTIRGLAHQDVLVVATTGNRPIASIPVALPANTRVAKFIPYHLLLPKVDVMVTNGGYGGVQFALAHGVPLVVAGERGDQPETGARVGWSGIGQNLKTGRPPPERIAAAVTEALRQPGYRDAATRLAAQVRNTDALLTVTAALERTTASAGATA